MSKPERTEPEQEPETPVITIAGKISAYRTRAAELCAGLPEAGGIAFSTVYRDNMPINVTARAANPFDAIAVLVNGLELAKEVYRIEFVKAVPEAPAGDKVQERDPQGLPLVDGEGKPVMIKLAPGVRLYAVASIFHDKTKNGKDVLKVVTQEEPYNTKYGVALFHGGPDGWKSWPSGVDNKYVPPEGFKKVIIRDPEGESKYPEVIEFQK
jgi:hypothetical protein